MIQVCISRHLLNQYLLRRSGKAAKGLIIDCRARRSGPICLYRFPAGGRTYEVQTDNDEGLYKKGDAVAAVYYPACSMIQHHHGIKPCGRWCFAGRSFPSIIFPGADYFERKPYFTTLGKYCFG